MGDILDMVEEPFREKILQKSTDRLHMPQDGLLKIIVAAGIAKKCEVQLSYAIGVVEPISIRVETFGTLLCRKGKIEEIVEKIFDLTPRGIENR